MPQIIGKPLINYYERPRNVKVADRIFKNVYVSDKCNYIERGINCQVNYMETPDSHYSVYLEDNKIASMFRYYRNPVKKTIGGVKYDKIVSEHWRRDGKKQYENMDTKFLRTNIVVGSDDKVEKIDQPFELKVIKKAQKFFNKIFSKNTKLPV